MTYLLPTTNNTISILAGSTTTNSFVVLNTGAVEADLIINVVTLGGTSIVFTMAEVDPSSNTTAGLGGTGTAIGATTTGNTITAAGTQILKLSNTSTGALKISWTTVGTITSVYATLVLRTIPTNNTIPILINNTITASGSTVISGIAAKEINLITNILNAPTGTTPTLTFTLAEVDPGNLTTTTGASISGAAINAAGTQAIKLADGYTGAVKVSWAITGTSASFTGVYATITTKNTEDVIEQYAPVAEDNTNGVIATTNLPLAVAIYTPSYYQLIDGYVGTIKGSAGNLRSFKAVNKSTSAVYLQFFNQTGVPTGASTVLDEFFIPAGPSMVIVGEDFFSTSGVFFSTGISWGFSSNTNGTYSNSGLTSTNFDLSATYK